MMKPFVKWAGGKERELKFFSSLFPSDISSYVEPFLGGGAVYFDICESREIQNYYVNDFSSELIGLYKCITNGNATFFKALKSINADLNFLSNISNEFADAFSGLIGSKAKLEDASEEALSVFLDALCPKLGLRIDSSLAVKKDVRRIIISKANRLKKLSANGDLEYIDSSDLLETILKSYYYTHIRDLYNSLKDDPPLKTAYFFYLREYCYSSMFRYNANGEFNVPYGGSAYNKKNFAKKLAYLEDPKLRNLLAKSTIKNLDFEQFLGELKLKKSDFVFVDPPYDSEFSDYAKNAFTKKDQARLANCLAKLKCNVMVVIKNTDFIFDLYSKLGFKITSFDKKYNVNFMNRNDRKVKHLIITNY